MKVGGSDVNVWQFFVCDRKFNSGKLLREETDDERRTARINATTNQAEQR